MRQGQPRGQGQKVGAEGRRPLAWVRQLRAFGLFVLVPLGVVLLVRTTVVDDFVVPSASMAPSIHGGDRVLVNRLADGGADLHRGDVVVFRPPASWVTRDALPHELLLIKRVIGVAGDTVRCCDQDNRLTVNGVPLTEPYLFPGDPPSSVRFVATVGPEMIWVMGDHRSDSSDSRSYCLLDGGQIPRTSVVGRAALVIWPPRNLGGLGGLGARIPLAASSPSGAGTCRLDP